MEPLDFAAKLAAPVPAPRRHQSRYHGTLAPNAAWRKLIRVVELGLQVER